MNASISRQQGSEDRHGLVLTIEAGQVVCPSRGIRDIESCFADLAIVGVVRAWGA